MKKKSEILDKIKETVRKIEPHAEIILFGSRARGDERKDSDWDLLILVPGSVDLKKEQKFRHALFMLEVQYGQAISTFAYSKGDWEKQYTMTALY